MSSWQGKGAQCPSEAGEGGSLSPPVGVVQLNDGKQQELLPN